jgi:hypothetical protein
MLHFINHALNETISGNIKTDQKSRFFKFQNGDRKWEKCSIIIDATCIFKGIPVVHEILRLHDKCVCFTVENYCILSCNQYICCTNMLYEYIFALFVLDE